MWGRGWSGTSTSTSTAKQSVEPLSHFLGSRFSPLLPGRCPRRVAGRGRRASRRQAPSRSSRGSLGTPGTQCTPTVENNRLLTPPGTLGSLWVRYRVCYVRHNTSSGLFCNRGRKFCTWHLVLGTTSMLLKLAYWSSTQVTVSLGASHFHDRG